MPEFITVVPVQTVGRAEPHKRMTILMNGVDSIVTQSFPDCQITEIIQVCISGGMPQACQSEYNKQKDS